MSRSDDLYYERLERKRKAKAAKRKEYEEGGEMAFRRWGVEQIHKPGATAETLKAIQSELRRRKRTQDWTIPRDEAVGISEPSDG